MLIPSISSRFFQMGHTMLFLISIKVKKNYVAKIETSTIYFAVFPSIRFSTFYVSII